MTLDAAGRKIRRKEGIGRERESSTSSKYASENTAEFASDEPTARDKLNNKRRNAVPKG